MAKSSRYTLDWSKLPEVKKSGKYDYKSGEWYFGEEELELPLEDLEHAIYANLAWYLFVKEQQDVSTEA